VVLPFALLILSIASALVLAFGTNPDLGRFHHGVDFIMNVRRLQGPLILVSILPCVILIVLVILNKRRAWWLLGLAPVLALFAYRFSFAQQRFFSVAEVTTDSMLRVDEVSFLRDEDWIVGVVVDGEAYAYPYSALFATPAVVHTDRDKRWLIVFSPFANYSSGWIVERILRGRDMEIVSMPANATLVYSRQFGEFINGITGLNQDREIPPELKSPLRTHRMTYAQWRAKFPDTHIMPPVGANTSHLPPAPVKPLYPMPRDTPPIERSIAIIPTTQPIAIATNDISTIPANLNDGSLSFLIFRDAQTGEIRAFDRKLEDDLIPRFRLNDKPGRRAWMVDSDTNTGWDSRGFAVEGELGKDKRRLRAIEIQTDLSWGIMKYWIPELKLVKGSE
jgi:hypothetical protein